MATASSFDRKEKLQPFAWKVLAFVDAELTEKFIDSGEIRSHKLPFIGEFSEEEIEKIETLKEILGREYELSLQFVDFRVVEYLPSGTFSPLGAFSKINLSTGCVIPGLTGILSEISPVEIQEGVNDFSIIKSGRLNKTWLMLGPISFVNASCDANIEYSRKGFTIQAVVKRDIVVDEELSVFYDKHFFGEFNVECLCPFIKKHGNPFPEISQPKRRKQVNINHQPVESTPKVPHTRIVREYFSVKDPIHRFGYINLMENESSDSESETIRDYATVFGTFDHYVFEDVSSIQGDELLNDTLVSLESPRDISDEFVSNSANVESNKTGTSEVGALSKAQTAQNPFWKKT